MAYQNVGNLTVGNHVGAPIGISTGAPPPNSGSAPLGESYGTDIVTYCTISKAIMYPVPIATTVPDVEDDTTTAYFIGCCRDQGYIAINVDDLNILSGSSAFIVSNSSKVVQTIVFFTKNGGESFNNIILNNANDYVTFCLAPNRTLFIGNNYVLHL